jgi:ATP-dependent Lon protease
MKIVFQKRSENKSLIVYGLLDDVLVSCIYDSFIYNTFHKLTTNKPNDELFHTKIYDNYLSSLSLKDVLIYDNKNIYNRFAGYINQIKLLKHKPISIIIKEFINSDLYGKRNTLIHLLINEDNIENQYLAYLLYDLLSNDDKKNDDTMEQTIIYDTLPWNIKKIFKNAMNVTIQYTKSLSNFDNNKIPLEQQICLMKVDEIVKEKAMVKLKEVKSKSEDNGSKARQYLEALLRIPFGIYKSEQILFIMKECCNQFGQLIESFKDDIFIQKHIPYKSSYTTLEISNYIQILNTYIQENIENDYDINKQFYQLLTSGKRDCIINNIIKINTILKSYKLFLKNDNTICKDDKLEILKNIVKLKHSGKKREFMIQEIEDFLNKYNNKKHNHNKYFFEELCKAYNIKNSIGLHKHIQENVTNVESKWLEAKNTMSNVRNILNSSVHGHERAKRQLERIIGQWMTGEQSGYCFGFEGSPGLGKTTLAKKGLAKCLVDEDGQSRPFGFIAIGGSSNGSTLEGHNYTYVGSTWGRIVDILMESKCMNPIIFIDELDKVSKTEHGKEIIGILTHLVDQTQNDTFQDKYFTGINIDLSKALFIFSYNDVSLIDKILLDRIHRIKFDNLSIDEKITITYDYILPEIFEKIGVGMNKDLIHLSDDVIKFIIENYTYEAGVRKLKEILFEIISEINLEILKKETTNQIEIPFEITCDIIKNKYLKDRQEIKHKTIHSKSEVGVINGLWANAVGQGGIIPIQVQYFPTSTFLDLKLTGMQGDVMKESMNVAKTLAFSLTCDETKKTLIDKFNITKMQGIHIHCPEGAVPKDGPSAGTAITISIYSLLNNMKIKNNVAITGEINLQGYITAIGGLDLKILGGIRAGITTFIFPEENSRDFDLFIKKYGEKKELNNIVFHKVSHINDVFTYVFDY